MSLISLLVTVVVVGILLYIVQMLIPMDPRIRTIVSVVVLLAVVVWLLESFGLIGHRVIVR